jgi:HAD superfamily hydrolase (TIGR01509 family)
MTIPKIVVFDLGKVLVDFDYGIAGARVAARARMPLEELRTFLSSSPLLFRYETGLMTKQEFYNEICAASGYSGTLDEFCHFFADIFVPIEPMVKLHAELRQRGYPTYLFSNTNELAVGHIRRNFPFFGNFDGYILSYEVRAMKPDPKIYEALEQMANRRGADVLYLDDRPENVEAGAARGWQIILHEQPDVTRKTIEKLGMLNGV